MDKTHQIGPRDIDGPPSNWRATLPLGASWKPSVQRCWVQVKAQGRQQPNSGTAAAMAFQDNAQTLASKGKCVAMSGRAL